MHVRFFFRLACARECRKKTNRAKHIKQGDSALNNMPERMLQPALHGLHTVLYLLQRIAGDAQPPWGVGSTVSPPRSARVLLHGCGAVPARSHGSSSSADASSPNSTAPARLLDSAEHAGADGRSYLKFTGLRDGRRTARRQAGTDRE